MSEDNKSQKIKTFHLLLCLFSLFLSRDCAIIHYMSERKKATVKDNRLFGAEIIQITFLIREISYSIIVTPEYIIFL